MSDLDFLRGMQGAPAEAADELERLRLACDALAQESGYQREQNERLYSEVERLRAALREIANPANDEGFAAITSGRFSVKPLTDIARRALEGSE